MPPTGVQSVYQDLMKALLAKSLKCIRNSVLHQMVLMVSCPGGLCSTQGTHSFQGFFPADWKLVHWVQLRVTEPQVLLFATAFAYQYMKKGFPPPPLFIFLAQCMDMAEVFIWVNIYANTCDHQTYIISSYEWSSVCSHCCSVASSECFFACKALILSQ